jgi:preprotein translocase subunit SecG
MFSMLLILLIIVAVVMVLVILMQKSAGSGMSGSQAASMFGGALTGASAGNFFTKLTAWLATLFFVICAVLAFLVSKQGTGVAGRSEVREALVQDSKPAESSVNPADIKDEPDIADPAPPAVPEN